jgi:hypothetical protein
VNKCYKEEITMAGAACKVIINMGVKALTEAVERILIDPNVHQNRLPETIRMELIQRLADNDIIAYKGDSEPSINSLGVSGIVIELQRYGLVTDEVWQVYNLPVTTVKR